jgi:hypothetical protein
MIDIDIDLFYFEVECVPFCENRIKVTKLTPNTTEEMLRTKLNTMIDANEIISIHFNNTRQIAIVHLHSKQAKQTLLEKQVLEEIPLNKEPSNMDSVSRYNN